MYCTSGRGWVQKRMILGRAIPCFQGQFPTGNHQQLIFPSLGMGRRRGFQAEPQPHSLCLYYLPLSFRQTAPEKRGFTGLKSSGWSFRCGMVYGSNVVMRVGFSPFFHSAPFQVGFISGTPMKATWQHQQHLSDVTVAEECYTWMG